MSDLAHLWAVDDLAYASAEAWTPPPHVPACDWIEENYRLPDNTAARPGPMILHPWQRPVIEAWEAKETREVVVQASSQTGKTETLLALSQYAAQHRPGPSLLYLPTDEMAATFSKDRLRPAVEANDITAKSLAGRRSEEGSTINRFAYDTGTILSCLGGSVQNLSSRPAKTLFASEVARFKSDTGAQGNPVQMMRARGKSFSRSFKMFIESTPTVDNDLINSAWKDGTRERWNMTCRHCGAAGYASFLPEEGAGFYVAFSSSNPDDAGFACFSCGVVASPQDRLEMIRGGYFKATNDHPIKGRRSFLISELEQTTSRLDDLARRYTAAIKSPIDLQAFFNLALGLPFHPEARTVQISAIDLQARAEPYRAQIILPEGVLQIVAGVDAQQDRFEAAIYGFGEGGEAWLLDYEIIPGHTEHDGDAWRKLEGLLARTYRHPYGGELGIETAFLDSGGTGGYTQTCYLWSAKHQGQGRRWVATKGREGDRELVKISTALLDPGSGRTAQLRIIGVDVGKADIFARLELTEPGPGFIHFPDNAPAAIWDGLANSEKAVVKGYDKATGEPIVRYVKTGIARNEPLDCTVLALAAASIYPLDVDRRRRDLTVIQQPETVSRQAPDYSRYGEMLKSINAQARR